MARVVVGLSGGVDSSVSAYLLQEAGHEVIGIFMRNWHDESVVINNECPWVDDSADALRTAEHLGIPFQVIDFSEAYKKRIVDYMFAEYQAGRTPNPDVLCNREIKFDVFLDAALALDADYVATGHYVRKDEVKGDDGSTVTYRLLSGLDNNKDQSYFLCQISQEQLAKALFPIGHLQKSKVREIAKQAGLPTAEKKDSQGLCFVGKIKLPDFLKQQLAPKVGDIIYIPQEAPVYQNQLDAFAPVLHKAEWGRKIGEHQGAHYYTVGQRKGLGVGGFVEPLFIIEKDVENNLIYVGEGEKHPGLLRKGLKVATNEIHWIRPDLALKEGESKDFLVRIRYRQPLEKATLVHKPEGLFVSFENAQSGVAAGQFVAWYIEDELIGSGVIS
ncbi:MAG: tRNA 2-thiouridine(34) synthase MnmA [Luteibaculaceae bacterium]